jgi:DNA mismatch repair protein MutS2
VDEQALGALEFADVVQRLVDATVTPYGAERARLLVPAANRNEVTRRHSLTGEGIVLLDHGAEPPLHGICDVRATSSRAARGGVLTADALADIAATIEGALRARQSLQEHELAPALSAVAAGIEPRLSQLAEEIRRRVEEDGAGLHDAASPRLRRLRDDLRAGRRRVEDALQRLVRAPALQAHLQESFIVERAGRPVLALKASSRSSLPGIVHDASGSGQTLFVEPYEVVELNNRRSEAAAEEREEVERLLGELSRLVGEHAGALADLVEAAGVIDLAVAAGALSRGWAGTPVTIGERVRLVGARHPLLDPAAAVPIDLELDLLRAVVISGPNTGGKTVALKTIGLAVLLHQSGLRPPAVEAELPIFDAVLVEIGDQQSIAMSLSTFAAHVRNLIEILDSATGASLVLVDELASGTDPVEGAALAQALLERFAQQARLTVVTTHYPELKGWASDVDGAANAATAVDPETHEPLYRIVVGRAGTSHALRTAERLGLDAEIVASAESSIAPARHRIAALLAEAEAAERTAVAERAAALDEHRDAREASEQARQREAALVAEIERVRASAGAERQRAIARAHADLAAARAELDSLREEIRAARRRQNAVERASASSRPAEQARDRRLGTASEHASRAERELDSLEEPLAVVAPLAVGDPVHAPTLGVRGTIVAIHGEMAEVAGNSGQRVRIALARLQPHARAGAPTDSHPLDLPRPRAGRDRRPRSDSTGSPRSRPHRGRRRGGCGPPRCPRHPRTRHRCAEGSRPRRAPPPSPRPGHSKRLRGRRNRRHAPRLTTPRARSRR